MGDVRKLTTKTHYPDKMGVDEFTKNILKSCPIFVSNMKKLGTVPMYAEDWVREFAAWMEMN